MGKKHFKITGITLPVIGDDGRRVEYAFESGKFLSNGDLLLTDRDGNEFRLHGKTRLWGYVGDEPWLGENLPAKPQRLKEPVFLSKSFFKDSRGITQVVLENPPRTFTDMRPNAVMDTQDVARVARCSPLTVLRHANAKRLKIHPKSSAHDFYYLKRDVEAWLKQTSRFKRGRPRKEKKDGN